MTTALTKKEVRALLAHASKDTVARPNMASLLITTDGFVTTDGHRLAWLRRETFVPEEHAVPRVAVETAYKLLGRGDKLVFESKGTLRVGEQEVQYAPAVGFPNWRALVSLQSDRCEPRVRVHSMNDHEIRLSPFPCRFNINYLCDLKLVVQAADSREAHISARLTSEGSPSVFIEGDWKVLIMPVVETGAR